MLFLFSAAVNPRLPLIEYVTNWRDISMKLREPPRKRRLQVELMEGWDLS